MLKETGVPFGTPVSLVDLRGIEFSRELRARSGSALTVHRTVIHFRTRSIPSNFIKTEGAPHGAPSVLVDLRGIEPLSEHSFIQPSPRTVAHLKFPFESTGRQVLSLGSTFLHDRLKCERPMHVHR